LYFIGKVFLIWKGYTSERMEYVTTMFKVLFITLTIIIYSIWFTTPIPTVTQNIILYCCPAISVFEIVFLYNNCKERKTEQFWIFVATLLLFFAGFLFQRTSKSGSAMCDPDSSLQGHAVWHVLSGLAATLMFYFFLGDNLD
jgi:uncharacterized membrane protein